MPQSASKSNGVTDRDAGANSVEADPAVRFEGVSISFNRVPIVENVSASVPKGGSTAIVGPNGAGKTSLLLALLGEVSYSGKIRLRKGRDHNRPRIGYVPQRMQFDRGLPVTVADFLVMGLQRRPLWLGRRREALRRAREMLAAVRSEALESRRLGVLSGGEFQRVLLALALERDPDLLVLDEPGAGVDVHGEQLFCEILERLRHERGFTQLMVSHDLPTVTHHATHVIMINRSLIAEGPPSVVLTQDNLATVFGIHMGLANARAMPSGRSECSCERCKEDDDA